MAKKNRVLERHYAIEAAYNTNWATVERNASKNRIKDAIDMRFWSMNQWSFGDSELDTLVNDDDITVRILARMVIELLYLVGWIYDELDR